MHNKSKTTETIKTEELKQYRTTVCITYELQNYNPTDKCLDPEEKGHACDN